MAEKEYIEREAAIAEIEEWHDMYPDSDAAREALSLAKRAVRKIPAADVRPVVRGKWEQVDDYRYPWGCTNCRRTFSGRYNFCPNCGAMMEES